MVEADAFLQPIDLSLCEREPIHTPAAIQPHGAVLIATSDSFASAVVTHASANIGRVLGRPAAAVLGRMLSEVLVDAAATPNSTFNGVADSRGLPAFINGPVAGQVLQLRSYAAGSRLGVDIEPASASAAQIFTDAAAQAVLESFETAHSRLALCELAVRGIRAITGYDRVMAYQFAADGHGEVVAEALGANLEGYLGQRYPASDIPPQARRLYLVQRVGAIADSNYEPVPLLSAPGIASAEPVDLTHSVLRSVSPLHREFMRNMKTAASLTVGLAQRDAAGERLWGMLVCHHATPRIAGPEVRALAGVVGQVVSLLLESLRIAEVYTLRMGRNDTLRAIVERLGAAAALPELLRELHPELLRLLDASGVLMRIQGHFYPGGRCPPLPVAQRIFAILEQEARGELHAVESLGLRRAEFAELSCDISGALFLPSGINPGDGILWFRPEQEQTIIWAGDPAKPARPDPMGGRISPRVSFAAWREIVRGRSQPWTTADRALALDLRRAIDAEIARRTKLALTLFDQMFESAPTALLLVKRAGEIQMLNRQSERLFGYNRSELLGSQLVRLLSPSQRERFLAALTQQPLLPVESSVGQELLGLRRDGTEFPMELSLSGVDRAELTGEPLIQISITDLTARRDSERQRRHAQQRLESVARHVPAMIGYWDRQLRCEFANEFHRSWFGLAPEQIIGMPLKELIGAEHFARSEIHIHEVLAGREQRFEEVVRRLDGTESYVDEHYVPDFASGGQVQGFYVLMTDVTALRRTQSQLESVVAKLQYTNHELEQFVYTASHDLRSPLRGIASLVQFITEDDRTIGRETQDRLTQIQHRANRMQEMLNDVLVYAHAGTQSQQEGPAMSATALVDEICASLTLPPGFVLEKDASLQAVQVRQIPLEQVLQNLIGNAIKHHDRPIGHIAIGVAEIHNRLQFSVTDDGPGIPEAYRESVFEMFSTLKPRDEMEGSGMGLALVRKLVRRFGGNCGVDAHTGRGARVWFDWPMTNAEAQ